MEQLTLSNNPVECPVCGAMDNDCPARCGLCLDCFCKALYLPVVRANTEHNYTSEAVEAFKVLMLTDRGRNAAIDALKRKVERVSKVQRSKSASCRAAAVVRNEVRIKRYRKGLEYIAQHLNEAFGRMDIARIFGYANAGDVGETLLFLERHGLVKCEEWKELSAEPTGTRYRKMVRFLEVKK